MGPTVWNLIVDELLEDFEDLQNTKIVAYADDLALTIEGNTRKELEENTKLAIDKLENWTNTQKLTISKKKTMYMLLKGKLLRNQTCKINGESIKRVSSVKYLGLQIDENETS